MSVRAVLRRLNNLSFRPDTRLLTDIRKANVAKILGEMEIDDFLGEGSKSGDLTSRFDQTFFLGDLKCVFARIYSHLPR